MRLPRKSAAIDAPPTNIAASGPKTTAAKRVGRSEIESSRFALSRTRRCSAIAESSARAASGHSGVSLSPETISDVAINSAATPRLTIERQKRLAIYSQASYAVPDHLEGREKRL